ncbi:DUF6924 domain-containing protein [Actinophytocola glycyrrhizae]|uniref:DUF6924 domain-containing protein n=1 Tax=Actinophytocola glycyrrhizae TaxID=2044873 RepID=A0ABV9SF85_9PSEU
MTGLLSASVLVRTWFGDDGSWGSLVLEVHTPSDQGFQANIAVVNDPVFEGLTPEALRTGHTGGAIVSFIADETTLVNPEHPILAVWVLPRPDDDRRDLSPFRVVPAALWSVENNINLGNMDWADFTRSSARDGVFHGF